MKASSSSITKQQIARLPDETVGLIRSSTVIPDWPTALRELLHNAIDADAKQIKIEIDAEQGCIAVHDNGSGFSMELFKIIGTRYSKLASGKLLLMSSVSQQPLGVSGKLRFGTRGEG
jgi:DNA mismatch repair ATPase MutL